ncbi:AraC family transcriptional regulator [Hamadaea sp. NPDC050747]|uniref:AraC family transcriptional regulator n=1 Tax=Hamadaea sp. NPDC050747 TaxID=3155789 RepID=UPI0033C7148F
MDVLSDVISVMRTGRPRSAQVTWHAPWAQRFAGVPGSAGFQIILSGPCTLVEPGPVVLAPGDVLLLPHGRGLTLADNASTPVTVPECESTGPPGERGAVAVVGEPSGPGAPATVTLCGAYELDRALTHPFLLSLPELIHLPAHLGRHPELRTVVDLLAAELAAPRLGGDAAVRALLDTLLLLILRSWVDDAAPDTRTGWAAALRDPATVAALDAVHRDPARPWTVAALAAEAGLSRAPFARRFAELTGRPPLAYLTWWRMTLAARLLRQTDAPLHAIARRVGYGSEYAFTAAFKRQYASPPGRYRRSG